LNSLIPVHPKGCTPVRFSHERPPKQDDLEVIASGVDQAQFPPFSRETAGETLSAMKIEAIGTF